MASYAEARSRLKHPAGVFFVGSLIAALAQLPSTAMVAEYGLVGRRRMRCWE